MTPTGRNRCDSGVSTEATVGGTSLRIRNRRASQLVAPALSTSAEAPNSTTPRHARSSAVRVFGTRTVRFGHHQEVIGRTRPWRRLSNPSAGGWPLPALQG
jgi:hypothetical protein